MENKYQIGDKVWINTGSWVEEGVIVNNYPNQVNPKPLGVLEVKCSGKTTIISDSDCYLTKKGAFEGLLISIDNMIQQCYSDIDRTNKQIDFYEKKKSSIKNIVNDQA